MSHPDDDLNSLEQQISILRGRLGAKKLNRQPIDPEALRQVENKLVAYMHAVSQAEALIQRRPDMKGLAECLGYRPTDDYNAWLNSLPPSLRSAFTGVRIAHDTVREKYNAEGVQRSMLSYEESAFKLLQILECLHCSDEGALEAILEKDLVTLIYDDNDDEDEDESDEIVDVEIDGEFEEWSAKHAHSPES